MNASRHLSGVGSQNYISPTIDRNAAIFGYTMVFLQIGLSLIYGFLISVPSVQLNVSSVIITSGLAILVIAGTHKDIQVSGLCLDILSEWPGVVLDLHSSSLPFALKSILSSMTSGPR